MDLLEPGKNLVFLGACNLRGLKIHNTVCPQRLGISMYLVLSESL